MLRNQLSPCVRKWLSLMLLAIGLVGVFVSGLVIRRVVLQTQIDAIGSGMPFTLESALHYRRVKMYHDRGFLPEVDEAIQYPEGIKIREIDSVSSEPVVARLARLFPESIPFPDRIRWIEAAWFCLSIPLLALTLRLWTGAWLPGLVAALLYAVSLAAVLRTTGQEISRENFAFPWLLAASAAAAGYYRASGLRALLGLVGFAAATSFALIGWDMMQYMLGLASLGMMIHALGNRNPCDRRLFALFITLIASVGLTGLLHPYYRFHGLVFSPMYVWMLAVSVGVWYRMRNQEQGTPSRDTSQSGWSSNPQIRTVLIMLLPPVLLMVVGLTGSYGVSYGHFGELLVAKIRFLNEKPADPGVLTYYQRIMWVPSLHSATWELTKWLFPYSLWPISAFGIAAWFISRKRLDPFIRFWLLVLVVSLLAYVLFVRFHVFVVLALSMVAGWMCSRSAITSTFGRIIMISVVLISVAFEATHTVRQRMNMGRPNVYYQELSELAGWLKEHVAPQPVLANMGVSAYIATYGKCPIVIHPKFEDPVIRNRLETYGKLVFGSDEKTLRDWMNDLGVEYFVYSKGEFASEKPEYQMRYFVDMMEPEDDVPARRFEREDESLHYFQRQWGNRKYVVYRILTRAEEDQAMELAKQAEAHLTAGHLELAEQLAMEAIAIDRQHEHALKVLRHVGSLIEQGVRYQPGDPRP
jgi:hypothetical protein